MAEMTVSQAIVAGAIDRIKAGKPMPGRELTGEHTIVLTAAEREQVLKVLSDFVDPSPIARGRTREGWG